MSVLAVETKRMDGLIRLLRKKVDHPILQREQSLADGNPDGRRSDALADGIHGMQHVFIKRPIERLHRNLAMTKQHEAVQIDRFVFHQMQKMEDSS